MQKYLLTALIKESLKEEERKALLDLITKKFSNVIKEDLWGLRGLTYPIKKQQKAFYAHYEFEAEPAVIPSLDKSLKLDEDILRYLIIKVEVKKLRKQKKRLDEKIKPEEGEQKKLDQDDLVDQSQVSV